MGGILTIIVQKHRKVRVVRPPKVVWSYRTTWTTTTRFTPYELVYGKKLVPPTEFKYTKLRKIVELYMNLDQTQKDMLHQLNALDEIRM